MANENRALSWWRLNETAGPDALDMRGLNNATYNGGVTLGGAAGATFNGTTGYVSCPTSASLDAAAANSWWVAAKVIRGPIGANRTIVSKGNSGWNLRLDDQGRPQIVKSNIAVLVQAPAAIDTNPHVIAMTKTAGSNLLRLFVDGVMVASATPAAGNMPVATTLPLTIGCDSFNPSGRQEFWNGTILGVGFSETPLGPQIVEPVFYTMPGGPAFFLPAPAFLTTYRDPAAPTSTTFPATFDVLVYPGTFPASRYTSIGLSSTVDSFAYITAATGTPPASGLVSLPINFRYLDNDRNLNASVSTDDLAGHPTTWTAPLSNVYPPGAGVYPRVAFAIARVAGNVELGDAPTGLAVSSAMATVAKPADAGAVWYRAMTGPGLTDYAAGSVWTTDLATAAGQLPAAQPFLAVQFQLVRAV